MNEITGAGKIEKWKKYFQNVAGISDSDRSNPGLGAKEGASSTSYLTTTPSIAVGRARAALTKHIKGAGKKQSTARRKTKRKGQVALVVKKRGKKKKKKRKSKVALKKNRR